MIRSQTNGSKCVGACESSFSSKWYEVYDFIEFIALSHSDERLNEHFACACNVFLEREVSAYRFVDRRIVQIVAPEEIEAIESARIVRPGPVREHLDQALKLLADRRNPDYRNSIKESISAVEALVRSAMGTDKGTLGDLLKRMGREKRLHPALEGSFSGLYGYTSDADGIRHALLDAYSGQVVRLFHSKLSTRSGDVVHRIGAKQRCLLIS